MIFKKLHLDFIILVVISQLREDLIVLTYNFYIELDISLRKMQEYPILNEARW